MSQSQKKIAKHPVLKPAEDFFKLRRDGIGFIEQMASLLWTDYNTHDPGITTLEALCYAMSDLAYRIGWDIKDILSPETLSPDSSRPYPNQPFFTAREILTINPVTTDDFRRVLIDLPKIRNAWVFCKECSCQSSYYAWCDKGQLQLSYLNPGDLPQSPVKKVAPRGLYDVRVELEADPGQGDLNDRKIEYTSNFHDADGAHSTIMELRFPELNLADSHLWRLFLDSDEAFAKSADNDLFTVTLTRLGATKTYDLLSDPSLDEEGRNNYLRNHWRTLFYIDFTITFTDNSQKSETIRINNAALRVFSDLAAKNAMTLEALKAILEDKRSGGFMQRFRRKAIAAREAVLSAKTELLLHRNLDEDYCSVTVVGIEEVAVCADVEVTADADIEWVQAKIWFEIEQYFNPPIRFFTSRELQDAGEAVEEIFNGPELNCGFIRADDLEKASLKTELRVSDIINRLMEIDGVIAVNQVLLTKYDAEGNAVKGYADFDPNKTSASWLLRVSEQNQPRLYRNASRFLFYKNGLPFLPRMDEVSDTLNQLHGEAERPKLNNVDMELSIPTGTFRDCKEYYPVQYSLPLVYGTGPEGVPSQATELRQAQAKQMKAYLMVFEQMLGNTLAQLAHTADLFSLDPDIRQTYFVKVFSEELIKGFDVIKTGTYGSEALEQMTETRSEFFQRRNRFLDHLLARFGELFSEYALLLNNVYGKQVALERLIDDKIAFLKAYPMISHNRAKAYDYSHSSSLQENQPCIKKRISLLLGYPDLTVFFTGTHPAYGPGYTVPFELKDRNNKIWLKGKITLPAFSSAEAETKTLQELLGRMHQSQYYDIIHKQKTGLFQLVFNDNSSKVHALHPSLFSTQAAAEELQKELQAWSANERLIVVEHLLLRPKFPGDALYKPCDEGSGLTCCDEDPYSFRLTFVMPGWTTLYTDNLEMRGFAERTIREETPSHLLGKTCWVGNDDSQFDRFEEAWYEWLMVNSGFDWTEERLHERVKFSLKSSLDTTVSENSICQCATDILAAYGMEFFRWMEKKIMAGVGLDKLDESNTFIPPTVSIPKELIGNEEKNKSTAQLIQHFLDDRYSNYKAVSYQLWNVVNLLSKLRNIYPVATLHDCDAGSDINPVRLDNTALGGSTLSSSSEIT
jgi:hypothetical protein